MAKVGGLIEGLGRLGAAVLTLLLFSVAQVQAQADPITVSDVRLGDQGAQTRFVIETGQKAAYQVFTLADPYRVVIDLPAADFKLPTSAGQSGRGLISGYRYGQFQAGKSRIVLDITQPVAITRNFTLPAQSGFGHRIVLDLGATSREAFVKTAGWPTAFRTAVSAPRGDTPPVPAPARPVNARKVVVIDPGHGGIDPGAHGRSGVREKTVVLAFAREFARQLKATGRYDVYLTRDRDEFIRLRDRVGIARRRNADLFVSLHADSIKKSSVSGMAVYTLSETASDKEAAALAQKENLSDVIAGIDLEGESTEVADILIDLAQRETKNYSVRFARSVVDYAGKSTSLLQRPHRYAGFRVLKAPDVPSVLIELGFLTNRKDEKRLTSQNWRKKVSGGMVRAVDGFFGGRYARGNY